MIIYLITKNKTKNKTKMKTNQTNQTLTISSLLAFQAKMNKLNFNPYGTLAVVKSCIKDLIDVHTSQNDCSLRNSICDAESAIYELMDRWGSYIDSKYYTLKGERNSKFTCCSDSIGQNFIDDLYDVLNPAIAGIENRNERRKKEDEMVDKNIIAFLNS